MGTYFENGNLKAEAWVDKEKAEEKRPQLLDHIDHKLPMKISTGLFFETGLGYGERQRKGEDVTAVTLPDEDYRIPLSPNRRTIREVRSSMILSDAGFERKSGLEKVLFP